MANAASSAVSVTVRLAGALMPSSVCPVPTEQSTMNRRSRKCFMRCLSLRQAISDVGVEGVLRSRTATGGSRSARGAVHRRIDITDARVPAGVVRFTHALNGAQLNPRRVGQRLGLPLGIGEQLR